MNKLVLAICFSLVVGGAAKASECDVYSEKLILTPTPLQAAHSLRKLDDIIKNPVENPGIVLVGDSLLALLTKEIQHDLFPGQVVWNTAIGGTKIQGLLWELEAIKASGVADRMKPKSVVMMIGTNNLGEESTKSCALAQGLERAASFLSALWPHAHIYVSRIPPRGPNFIFADKTRLEVNQMFKEWSSTQKNITLFEASDRTLTCGEYGASGELRVNACGEAVHSCPNYKADAVHFEPGGYKVLHAALQAAMRGRSIH